MCDESIYVFLSVAGMLGLNVGISAEGEGEQTAG